MDSAKYPVPLATLTFDPGSGYYGFSFRLPGRSVHDAMCVFETLEGAKRWAD
jgi:hypothetical protein